MTSLRVGDGFGEIALLYKSRAFSVKAWEPAIFGRLIEILSDEQ